MDIVRKRVVFVTASLTIVTIFWCLIVIINSKIDENAKLSAELKAATKSGVIERSNAEVKKLEKEIRSLKSDIEASSAESEEVERQVNAKKAALKNMGIAPEDYKSRVETLVAKEAEFKKMLAVKPKHFLVLRAHMTESQSYKDADFEVNVSENLYYNVKIGQNLLSDNSPSISVLNRGRMEITVEGKHN